MDSVEKYAISDADGLHAKSEAKKKLNRYHNSTVIQPNSKDSKYRDDNLLLRLFWFWYFKFY